jgi:hypothetical protein
MLMKKNGQLKGISVKTLVPIGDRYKRYVDSKCGHLLSQPVEDSMTCISALHSFLISPPPHTNAHVSHYCRMNFNLRLQVRVQNTN